MESKIENGILVKFDENDLIDGHFECPYIIEIGKQAFRNCYALKTLNLPLATIIGEKAFFGCNSLTCINFPQAEHIQEFAFWSCNSLININLPMATRIDSCAFNYCFNLTTINLPLAKIHNMAFSQCNNLTTIRIAEPTKIYGNAFYLSNNLKYIIVDDTKKKIEINNILKKLPGDLEAKEIIIKSEQINYLCNLQAVLNQNVAKDIHPHILNLSIQLGFFAIKKHTSVPTSEIKQKVQHNIF